MKRVIEIAASFTGTISTGSFENEKPFYSMKETIDLLEGETLTDDEIQLRQCDLHIMCVNQFEKRAEVAYQEKIAKAYQNLRFYDGDKGLKYPSVTSIIGWDKDFYMSPEHLQQYASRGSIIDKQVELFLKDGKWLEPKNIPEIYPDLVIVARGDLGLELDNVDFQAFYKAFPFKVIDQQKVVINHEHRYGGRREILCIIDSKNKGGWDKIKGVKFDVPTLLDVKATAQLDKTYVMKQNTAYAKANGEPQQIGAIHLKADNQCGYAKPVIETNLDKYWTLFLKDRENFKKRYGL